MDDVLNFGKMQDNFGRLHERNKEAPKAIKLLSKLFPNKVIV